MEIGGVVLYFLLEIVFHEGSSYSIQKNNPVFSKHNQIPSILQAFEVWHLQNLHHHQPLIALWIMTPSVIPAGDSGSHQE